MEENAEAIEKMKMVETAETKETAKVEETAENTLSSCVKSKTFLLEYLWISTSNNWDENYNVVYYAVFVFVITSSAVLPLTESYFNSLSLLDVCLFLSSTSNNSTPPFGIVESSLPFRITVGNYLSANYFVLCITSSSFNWQFLDVCLFVVQQLWPWVLCQIFIYFRSSIFLFHFSSVFAEEALVNTLMQALQMEKNIILRYCKENFKRMEWG